MLPATGRQHRVELIGIINKPLLLHLVGCLYYSINDAGQTDIKFVSKMLGHNLRASSAHKNKEVLHINTSANELFFLV